MVVVTGIGLVAPHGDNPHAMFDAVMRGESAVQPGVPRTARPAAAAVAPFDESHWFTKLQLPGVDRVSQIAVAAASWRCAMPARSTRRPSASACTPAAAWAARPRSKPPMRPAAWRPRAAAHGAGLHAQCAGRAHRDAPRRARAGAHLLGGLRLVGRGHRRSGAGGATRRCRRGDRRRRRSVDRARRGVGLAGTADAGFVQARRGRAAHAGRLPATAAASCSAKARPSSCWSRRSVRGNAARRAYAELAGCGISSDATHLTKPDAQGQARALRAALADAGLEPRDVGYCNAHGTATKIGDMVESEALNAVWGAAIDDLRVSSTKALHGHLLGAAGALEAAITVLALQRQQLPPNAHCAVPDPHCALNLVLEPGTRACEFAGRHQQLVRVRRLQRRVGVQARVTRRPCTRRCDGVDRIDGHVLSPARLVRAAQPCRCPRRPPPPHLPNRATSCAR